MKGTHLGEFEELVLLTIAALMGEAYSVAICDEIKGLTGRTVRLGMVHSVLNRLEDKGFVASRLGEATSVRGGKRKRMYTVTVPGEKALVRAREMREKLWERIPDLALRRI